MTKTLMLCCKVGRSNLGLEYEQRWWHMKAKLQTRNRYAVYAKGLTCGWEYWIAHFLNTVLVLKPKLQLNIGIDFFLKQCHPSLLNSRWHFGFRFLARVNVRLKINSISTDSRLPWELVGRGLFSDTAFHHPYREGIPIYLGYEVQEKLLVINSSKPH